MSHKQCQRCQSDRVAELSAKCSDCFGFRAPDKDWISGEVINGLGIGGGDYVEFEFCLDCGTIQGEWPVAQETVDALCGEVDRG